MTTITESARVVEARGLSKRYGSRVAVDALSFTVLPGKVTGFLGPNGAGKSTTMLVVSERAVEKHVANIFTKLDLPPSGEDHRRVLAVLRYLGS